MIAWIARAGSKSKTFFIKRPIFRITSGGDFLASACNGDASLSDEVLGLIEEDERGSSLLDGGVAGLARRFSETACRRPSRKKHSVLTRFASCWAKAAWALSALPSGTIWAPSRYQTPARCLASPARRGRFASEQRTLAQLNHPSIARLYDADTLADGTPWFVMEYVEGVPLTQYSETSTAPSTSVCCCFRAVCEAVQFAHSQAIIHRDLKPSNILVKADGNVGCSTSESRGNWTNWGERQTRTRP